MPARADHIPAIALSMRAADRLEVMASGGHTPLRALELSLALSALAWTGIVDRVPAVMWGVAARGSLVTGTGVPWLLGTDAVYGVRHVFLRQCGPYVARMLELFPRLENRVHAGNRLSMRWLRWCGFTIEEAAPEIINNEKFFWFWREI